MSMETMKLAAYGAFGMAGLFGILMVVLWFYLDIRSVVADLRGLEVKVPKKTTCITPKTELLEEQTTALASEVTALLNGYRLVLNEVVVHTEERI